MTNRDDKKKSNKPQVEEEKNQPVSSLATKPSPALLKHQARYFKKKILLQFWRYAEKKGNCPRQERKRSQRPQVQGSRLPRSNQPRANRAGKWQLTPRRGRKETQSPKSNKKSTGGSQPQARSAEKDGPPQTPNVGRKEDDTSRQT